LAKQQDGKEDESSQKNEVKQTNMHNEKDDLNRHLNPTRVSSFVDNRSLETRKNSSPQPPEKKVNISFLKKAFVCRFFSFKSRL
jgi:hypothetical protein